MTLKERVKVKERDIAVWSDAALLRALRKYEARVLALSVPLSCEESDYWRVVELLRVERKCLEIKVELLCRGVEC